MSYTYREILNQSSSWAQTIPVVQTWWSAVADQVPIADDTIFLFVGSGSSHYLAQSAAHVFQEVTDHLSLAVPPSEIFLSPASTLPRSAPVVAFLISRSGETSEMLLAADYLGQHAPNVLPVAVTCGSDTALAARARAALELPHAREESVVMTQSFTAMLLALQVTAGSIAQDENLLAQLTQLPELLTQHLAAFDRHARWLGEALQLDQFLFLGLGPSAGLAQEGALKLKEMTQVHAEAYSTLEVRHGPMSVVRENTAAILLGGLREQLYLPALEADLKRYGATLVLVAPYTSAHADVVVSLPEGLSDVARCILYLPTLQLFSYYRAVTLGLDPDRPRNLSQVVMLDAWPAN
jgi:glucosamine--fructose-6-phosphate aminotransferase (isomerizing)